MRSEAQRNLRSASGDSTPFAEHLQLILNDIAEDAEALGCEAEVARARSIVTEGTSADRQLAIFGEARHNGANPRDALSNVIDWMAKTTAA